jgi:hypothetical protein
MPRKNLLFLHEAIVIALINQPTRTASFDEIADFIEKRNLYLERKGNISLATQVMLRSTKSKGRYKHLFEEIGAGYIRLKDSYADFPLQLYSALQIILEPHKDFFEPSSKKINMVDPEWGENRKIEFNPKDVICIISKGTGRKKTIYAYQPGTHGDKSIKKFTSQQTLEKLRHEIDPLSHYLITVSKDTVVNVGCFKLSTQKILITTITDSVKREWPTFRFTTSKKAKEYQEKFMLAQRYYADFTSLQKTMLGYKQDFGL